MYALAAQSAGTNWVVLILVYVVILYVIHAPTEKRAEENPGDDRRDGSR